MASLQTGDAAVDGCRHLAPVLDVARSKQLLVAVTNKDSNGTLQIPVRSKCRCALAPAVLVFQPQVGPVQRQHHRQRVCARLGNLLRYPAEAEQLGCEIAIVCRMIGRGGDDAWRGLRCDEEMARWQPLCCQRARQFERDQRAH
eukprot:1721872-Pleurochrysis_carterae.AAC.1